MMSQCKFCSHPERDDFERSIVSKELTMSAAAEKIGCNKSSVGRHMRRHHDGRAPALEYEQMGRIQRHVSACEGGGFKPRRGLAIGTVAKNRAARQREGKRASQRQGL